MFYLIYPERRPYLLRQSRAGTGTLSQTMKSIRTTLAPPTPTHGKALSDAGLIEYRKGNSVSVLFQLFQS
jgi:hypothetical protein